MNDEYNRNTTSPEDENAVEEPVSAPDTAEETVETPDEEVNETPAEEPILSVEAEQVQPPENPIYKNQPYTNAPRQAYPNPQQVRPPYGNAPQELRPRFDPMTGKPLHMPPQPVNPSQAVTPPEKPKKKRTGLKVFAIIMAIILAFSSGVGVMALFGGIFGGNNNPVNNPDENVYESDNSENNYATDNDGAPDLDIKDSPVSPSAPSADGVLTTAQIAAKVKPSIVGIVVYTKNSTLTAGEGTGVVMGEDNSKQYTYIITCAHVISDPGIKVKVQTEKGILYDAEIVGLDERTDLGVVKIKASGLTKAEFGDSDALRVGDNVFAIGNPGGVEFFGSFTGGYVSAIDRPVDSEIGYTMKCIQHDAAINPGNSGGALVNVYGQVIGINSQKIAATNYEGMGFAIPMNSAREIIDQLTQYGYIPNRPKLGISYYPVSASTQYSIIALYKGLPAGTLIIDSIDEESALSGTKARRYDMIIAVNGQDLTTADVLLSLIENSEVGTKLTLTLCRVNNDYSVSTFDVEATLVEDKSGSKAETPTEPDYVNPFESYNPYGY